MGRSQARGFPSSNLAGVSALVRGRSGSAAIEYGIILPVLFLFVLGTIDMGRLLWTSATLARAVQAASRCAAVNAVACATTSQIQQSAISEAWVLPVTSSTFSVASQSCGLKVSASYVFTFLTPGLSSLTLNPTACFPQ